MTLSIQVEADAVDQLIATQLFADYQTQLDGLIEFVEDTDYRISLGITEDDIPLLTSIREEIDASVAQLDAIEVLYPYYDETGVPLPDKDDLEDALLELSATITDQITWLAGQIVLDQLEIDFV